MPRYLILLVNAGFMVACSLIPTGLAEQPDIMSVLTQEAQAPRPSETAIPFATRTPVGELEAPFIQLPGMQETDGPPVSEAVDPLCLGARFISDVTIPDGSQLTAGVPFTKTWLLENMGSCVWTPAFSLRYVGGNLPAGPVDNGIGITVAPGQQANLSIELVSPTEPGNYRADFQLVAPDGTLFGLGASMEGTVFLEIVVAGNADIELEIEGFYLCSQNYTTVQVVNIGERSFYSAAVSVKDLDEGNTLFERSWSKNPFMQTAKSCPPGTTAAEPGGIYYLAASIGPVRSKRNAVFQVELCTAENLQGYCIERFVSFLTP